MSTLSFQPEADRYYAEGYWRDGDLWTDFADRAAETPDKPALILDDRSFTFEQLRRAAIGVSLQLAQGGVRPGDIVVLLGRHSIEAAVAMLGCLHRGVVARAAATDVQRGPALGADRADASDRAARVRRRQGARQVRGGCRSGPLLPSDRA